MAFLDVAGRSYESLASDPNLVQMGHNCNHLPLAPTIVEAMVEVLRSGEFRNYAPSFGFEELRSLVVDDVGMPGMDALITHGATEAIYQTMAALLEPGDEVIVSDPAWPHIANFARSLGAKVRALPVYRDGLRYRMSADLIAEHLAGRTRMVAIVDPLNPTGGAYPAEEIRAICALAARTGIYVLHDSTYRDFSPSHESALRHYERAIMAVTLSKSAGFAGLRFGAVVTAPALMEKITAHQISRLGVSVLTQRGAIEAYRCKPRWLPELRRLNDLHRGMVAGGVAKSPGARVLVPDGGGNFVAIDVTQTGRTAEEVVASALGHGFVVRSGVYTSEEFGNRFLRVTTTVPTDAVEKFCAALPAIIAGR
jgi:histidinol-phosphate aminotransferase